MSDPRNDQWRDKDLEGMRFGDFIVDKLTDANSGPSRRSYLSVCAHRNTKAVFGWRYLIQRRPKCLKCQSGSIIPAQGVSLD